MKSSARKINLTSYDDLFKTDETRIDASAEKITEMPLTELFAPVKHPFKVLDDEAMREMAESVEKLGVTTPAIVRPREAGGYEIVAGNRRKRACELAGKETMPVIVREMDDDAATIIMVDSNLQRETLLPSEKAFSYKMKLEAMRRQGARTDLTSAQVGRKLESRESREILAEQVGESKNQISRYIRLTELIPPLLEMTDAKKLSFNPAVEISYLNAEAQEWLLDVMTKADCVPSLSQAQRMKKFSLENKLDYNVLDAIMSEQKAEPVKVTIQGDRLQKYFPKDYTAQQMERVIIKLLENWQKKRQEPERQER